MGGLPCRGKLRLQLLPTRKGPLQGRGEAGFIFVRRNALRVVRDWPNGQSGHTPAAWWPRASDPLGLSAGRSR